MISEVMIQKVKSILKSDYRVTEKKEESIFKKEESILNSDYDVRGNKEKSILKKEGSDREAASEEITDDLKLEETVREFIAKFNLEMFELKLINSFGKTYKIKGVELTPYGFNAEINLVPGLNFIKLEQNLKGLQQCLNSTLILNYKNNRSKAVLKVVLDDIDITIPYRNPNIKPNEIYLGLTLSHEPIIVDCNEDCMFLVAGATGSGKTRYLYAILLSWILSCSHTEIGLFIADLAKSEFCAFRDVKHVMGYAEELEELYKITVYILKEMARRKRLMSKYRFRRSKEGSATNISDYNRLEPLNKLKYMFILIDEFSTVNPDATDTNEEKEMKEKILAVLRRIAKEGRAYGVFCLIATQKTTKEEMPAIIKNMSSVRITFKANDSISSEVIIGDDSAVGLDKRVGIYNLKGASKGDSDYLFSAALDIDYMNEELEKHINYGYKKESIDMMIKGLDLRESQLQQIYKMQEKEKVKKENNVLSESSNLMRKSVITYEIQDYSKMNVVKEDKASYIPPKVETKKPPKNGWYALENERKKLNKK